MGAAVSMGMAVIGGGLGAYGSGREGQATAEADMYRAAVARNNAMVAEQNAQYATARGQQLEQRQKLITSQTSGEAAAAMAANGVRLDNGSPTRVLSDIELTGIQDANTIRENAAREAYGYRVQGTGFQAESMLLERAAQNAVKMGKLNMMRSLVSGGSAVSGQWSKYQSVAGGGLDPSSMMG